MTDILARSVPWEYDPAVHPGPLGRSVEHDPRSRQFPAVKKTVALRAVRHRRYGPVFDQGQLGSCTGNALAGARNTVPTRKGRKLLGEPDAVTVYEFATSLDEFPGTYPPDDTGSSGLSVCKAGVQLGWITRYEHAFGIEDALQALMARPVITGVDWEEGFDRPDARGRVTAGGQVRGGHEFEVNEYIPAKNPTDAWVGCWNSWGQWGLKGRFFMRVRDWATLLEAQGDVTVPV